jgi:hypothetical protein
MVGFPWDYHGLMVGGYEGVGLPEGGIVQLLHVHYPSGGAILLPDDHHAVLSDCVLVRWHLLQYPQLHVPGQLLLHFFLQWTSTVAGV